MANMIDNPHIVDEFVVFRNELTDALHNAGLDTELRTPAHLLADYLYDQLTAYALLQDRRIAWHTTPEIVDGHQTCTDLSI